MLAWVWENKGWIFSGIGVSVVAWVVAAVFKKSGSTAISPVVNSVANPVNNVQVNNYVSGAATSPPAVKATNSVHSKDKSDVRILFVDDDTRFRVVKILQSDGWIYTKIIKDVKSLESPEVLEANILFIDVQGVGRALGFANEGLGLALALKTRFPGKKVIIYSTQESGERFSEALRRADDFLSKNADPYEFISIVERMADEL